MTARYSALKLIDLLSLKPGAFLHLHAVRGEVECDEAEKILQRNNWQHEVSTAVFPNGDTKKQHNLSKLLDIAISTQIIIRYQDGKVIEIFHLDERTWNQIQSRLGQKVDIMAGNRIIARGIVTEQEGQSGILIETIKNP